MGLEKVELGVPEMAKATYIRQNIHTSFNSVLEDKLSKKAILLLIDEAHRYSPELFELLNNIIMNLQSQKFPLGVLFAGTPGLDQLIHRCKATFVQRYANIKLNTLDYNSTKLAISEPLRSLKIILKPEIVEYLANKTENYPYFIQLIGNSLWEIMEMNKNFSCNIELAKVVVSEYNMLKDSYYSNIDSEINDLYLRDHTYKIIQLINKGENFSKNYMIEYIMAKSNVSRESASEIYDKLINLGIFINTDDGYKPAIPSFYNYFINKFNKKKEKFIK